VRTYHCTRVRERTRRIPGMVLYLSLEAIILYRELGQVCCRLVKRRLHASGWDLDRLIVDRYSEMTARMEGFANINSLRGW